jgi:hypothetical protein
MIGYMKDFLFRPEQTRTAVGVLSGGELLLWAKIGAGLSWPGIVPRLGAKKARIAKLPLISSVVEHLECSAEGTKGLFMRRRVEPRSALSQPEVSGS